MNVTKIISNDILNYSKQSSSKNMPWRHWGITALTFLNLWARGGWVVHIMPWPTYPWETELVPTVQEVGWALGLAWTCTENVNPTRAWTSNRPAQSTSLDQLRYCSFHNYGKFPKEKETRMGKYIWMHGCKQCVCKTNLAGASCRFNNQMCQNT